MAQYQVTLGTQGTQCRLLMLVGGGWPDVKREQDPQAQPSGRRHDRLLRGGGHGAVTRTAHAAGPGSDSCSLKRKIRCQTEGGSADGVPAAKKVQSTPLKTAPLRRR